MVQDLSIDIPERFRSFVDYRTTLGHKVNHKFHPASNTEFQVVKHPLFGIICSLGTTVSQPTDIKIIASNEVRKDFTITEKPLLGLFPPD